MAMSADSIIMRLVTWNVFPIMAHLQNQQHSLLGFLFKSALAATCYPSSRCLDLHTYLIAPNALNATLNQSVWCLCSISSTSTWAFLVTVRQMLEGEPSAGGPYPHFAIRTRYCTIVELYKRVDSQIIQQPQSRHVVALLWAVSSI